MSWWTRIRQFVFELFSHRPRFRTPDPPDTQLDEFFADLVGKPGARIDAGGEEQHDSTGENRPYAAPRTFVEGDVIAEQFQIVRFLGAGGMGQVYEAEDRLRLDHKRVALKTLPPRLTADERAIYHLKRDFELAQLITHVNVCRVFGMGQHRAASGELIFFFTMELLDGVTLADRLHQGTLTPADALPLVKQIAAALDAMHAIGVVHGDLKPGNVMLVPSETGERLVVTDFGLARSRPAGSTAVLTTSGETVRGTPKYMAPEQFAGKITRASDIYALGVVIGEMVGGHDLSDDSGARAPASQWRRAIARCVRINPTQRFESAGAVVQALRPSHARLWLGAAAAAALVLLAVLFVRPGSDAISGGAAFAGTVAVLPFEPASLLPEDRAFARGATAAITDALRLLMRGRSPVSIRPAEAVIDTGLVTPAQVQQVLGATTSVTGRISREGGRTSIRLALIEASRGGVTETAHRVVAIPSGDRGLFAREVMAAIVQLIRIDSTQAGTQTLGVGTNDPAAERAYIMGRGYLGQDVEGSAAVAAFEEAVQRDHDFAAARAGLSSAYRQRFEATREAPLIENAKRSIEAAITLDAGNPVFQVALGRVHRALGDHGRAISIFEQALQMDPNTLDARWRLAAAYAADSRDTLAEKEFRTALSEFPWYWAVYENFGVFLYRRGRFCEAKPQFEKASEYAPAHAAAIFNLASIHLMEESFVAAENGLKRVLQLAPDADTHNNLGWLYLFERNLEQAIASFKSATAYATADSIVWSGLARAYRVHGRHAAEAADAYDEALSRATREIRANPRDAEIRANYAYLLAETGQRAEARNEIAVARQLAPTDVTVLFTSGLVYEQLNNRAAAIETVEAAARAGYSLAAIKRHPGLDALRSTADYSRLLQLAVRTWSCR